MTLRTLQELTNHMRWAPFMGRWPLNGQSTPSGVEWPLSWNNDQKWVNREAVMLEIWFFKLKKNLHNLCKINPLWGGHFGGFSVSLKHTHSLALVCDFDASRRDRLVTSWVSAFTWPKVSKCWSKFSGKCVGGKNSPVMVKKPLVTFFQKIPYFAR